MNFLSDAFDVLSSKIEEMKVCCSGDLKLFCKGQLLAMWTPPSNSSPALDPAETPIPMNLAPNCPAPTPLSPCRSP